MPFFLHELPVPEFVYDGKTLAKRTIAKILRNSTVSELSPDSVYNLSPNNTEEAFVTELVIFDAARAVMRLRKRFADQIANVYAMSSRRKIEYVDEPEMHYLGNFEGGGTFFPIIDDTQPQLAIKRVISWSEQPKVLKQPTRRSSGRVRVQVA